jgi:hypothetical protein
MVDVVVGVSASNGVAGFDKYCKDCCTSAFEHEQSCWNCNGNNFASFSGKTGYLAPLLGSRKLYRKLKRLQNH